MSEFLFKLNSSQTFHVPLDTTSALALTENGRTFSKHWLEGSR